MKTLREVALFRQLGASGEPAERMPRAASALLVVAGLFFMVMAWLRFHTFHNETFDLAFYSRMAWGLSGGSFWDPIVGAHVFGLHISPVLFPLGVLGRIFGTVEVLLAVQGAAMAATAWPLGRMAHRRLGETGMWVVLFGFLLYPNVFPVVSGEFHPGTLALFPLAWALDATDRGSVREVIWGVVLTLCCREDLGLVTGGIALLFASLHSQHRRSGYLLAALSFLYVIFFFLVLLPIFGPEEGSLNAHFGPWGSSVVEVFALLLTEPGVVMAHVFSAEKIGYLMLALLPFGMLPLFAWRWLAVTIPIFAINLLSHFPATSLVHDHYLSPAVPALFAAAIQGYRAFDGRFRLRETARERDRMMPITLVTVGAVVSFLQLHQAVSADAFHVDQRTAWAREAVSLVREGEKVQAPDELLPHLAERLLLNRAPPPDRGAEVVILSIAHRDRYRGDESLIRTVEEPLVLNWLAKDGFGLVGENPAYLVFRRGANPRGGPASRFFIEEPRGEGERIASCLEAVAAESLETRPSEPRRVRVFFRALGPCPHDLVIRLGTEKRPPRVEQLFGGVLSPARLQEGDWLFSDHTLPTDFSGERLRVGALRTSGTRPEHGDPLSVGLQLVQ